ncbi:nucleic acid dioxygenase ALKBH1 [Armigeres subalbatus]|uniref:nucleic acid dioxygenase ALKBH1 n=1 Tax=Armigeres subalbatus TaxID=124917 RepID=UPI002ED0F25E
MFQEAFKYYKARNPPPSLDNVIDLCSSGLDHRLKIISPNTTRDDQYAGLIPTKQWHIYELVDRPGLILIANPFTKCAQRHWMARSILDYPKHPNRTNLPETIIDKYGSYSNDDREHFDWWSVAQSIEDSAERAKLWKALRWTTLGYHYDWTNKVYDEAARSEFPPDLAELCRHFAESLGFHCFRPEAAIVNYYPTGSTLAGHTDHSEKNLEAPLFSFSFGQPAIFLIGGPSRDEKPDALLLRSGDVIVMTRESRLCYHAVPKVFPCRESSLQRWAEPEGEDAAGLATEEVPPVANASIRSEYHRNRYWRSTGNGFADYISNSRININIRQVLNEGENHL